MTPILQTALAAAFLFAGVSISAPQAMPPSSETWTKTFSNFTSGLNSPDPLCGLNPETMTFGPAQVDKCIVLPTPFTRWKDIAVGSAILENCFFFFEGETCGVELGMDDAVGALETTGLCKGVIGTFASVKYADTGCNHGSGGK